MKWPAKSRCFTFTTFDLEIDYANLIGGQVRYIAYGEEICPTTKKQHHQGWIYFVNQKSTKIKSLLRIGAALGKAHVEPMMGSLKENDAYCSKESTLKEFGDKPKQGSRGDLEDVVNRIADGQDTVENLTMTDPEFYHQYGRTLEKAETIALRKRWRKWMTKGIWITGPSGCGKSHEAFNEYNPETHYIKNVNEDWWDGYTGQETVIINEFRGEIRFSEMLDLVDKWPKSVKIKGKESVPFLAKTVIVTSIKTPQQVYCRQEGEPWEQFNRRFEVRTLAPRGLPAGLAGATGVEGFDYTGSEDEPI